MPAKNSADPATNLASYDYGIVRVVPMVERGEFLNVGAILFCRTRRFLDARIECAPARLTTLAPYLTPAQVERINTHLQQIPRICAGAGPIGQLPQTERFHWLVAPRSTIIQVSAVHSGLCSDPTAVLEQIMDTYVRVQPAPALDAPG